VKSMFPPAGGQDDMAPLDFNIFYGPHSVRIENIPAFIIPIKPQYHRLLFPESEPQLELSPGGHACGNSIRKGYLCNALIRRLPQGANLLFYRSEDIRAVTSLGVLEEILVSGNSIEVARFVGKRTVYNLNEIEALCQADVLALLFRQARVLTNPITFEELVENGCLSTPPQSVQSIPQEKSQWLQTRLAE
jgi:hypothetical protein